MIRYAAMLSAVALMSACAPVDMLEPQFPAQFIPTNAAEGRHPIQPDGVAVLYSPPACSFESLGEVRVRNYQIDITQDRIKKLKEQAALYGADAIIVHPNLPVCADGTHPPVCAGRGEYVIATAIDYLDDQSAGHSPILEQKFKRGYDTIETYRINQLIDPSSE